MEQYGRLNVTGSLTLDGAITIELAEGFDPPDLTNARALLEDLEPIDRWQRSPEWAEPRPRSDLRTYTALLAAPEVSP